MFSFPDDIRINTHAAFATDPTTATGYSAALGAPEGRYLCAGEPARTASPSTAATATRRTSTSTGRCSRASTCGVKKLFPFLSRGSFELDIEMLNVFDTINFNHSVAFNTAEVTDTFRVTSAYTDINTTFDPGGRIGQIVWRINW